MTSRFERFKNWLRHSGIRLAVKKVIDKEDRNLSTLMSAEIIDSLNPFDAIVENPSYPMARIYRESPWRGILDTWQVLMGNHYTKNEYDGRKGVLDLLGFPIAARHLLYLTIADTTPWPLKILTGIVGGLLEVARQALGLALTIALSPVVLLVHLALAIPARFLRVEAAKVELNTGGSQKKLLSTLLNEHNVTLSDVEPEEIVLEDNGVQQGGKSMSQEELQFFKGGMAAASSYKFQSKVSDTNVHFSTKQAMQPQRAPAKGPIDPMRPAPVKEVEPVNPEQEKAMEAFRALNIGGRRV